MESVLRIQMPRPHPANPLSGPGGVVVPRAEDHLLRTTIKLFPGWNALRLCQTAGNSAHQDAPPSGSNSVILQPHNGKLHPSALESPKPDGQTAKCNFEKLILSQTSKPCKWARTSSLALLSPVPRAPRVCLEC